MSNVINFPSEDLRESRELEAAIDQVPFPSEELKQAVKQAVIPHLKKYGKLQAIDISVELPIDITYDQETVINEQVRRAIRQYADKVQMEMLSEIVKLATKVCKLEAALSDGA